MNELIAKIEQWAEDRNIINGTRPIDQAMKLFSEFGELADNVGKGRDCRDDIGDVFVVLTIMAKQYDIEIRRVLNMPLPAECLCLKWDVASLGKSINDFVLEYNEILHLGLCISFLSFICKRSGYTLQECVEIAYNDIKDRKGIVYNGLFIKESDPAYQDALDNIEADKRMATQKRISVNIEDL